jgi:hypothetical protein
MKRVLSIIVLILALVGLSAPSVSLGMGISGPEWSSVASDASGAIPIKLVGCKSLGGKRLLPCHPDQGVIIGLVVAIAPSSAASPLRRVPLPGAMGAPKAELPPPRLS